MYFLSAYLALSLSQDTLSSPTGATSAETKDPWGLLGPPPPQSPIVVLWPSHAHSPTMVPPTRAMARDTKMPAAWKPPCVLEDQLSLSMSKAWASLGWRQGKSGPHREVK